MTNNHAAGPLWTLYALACHAQTRGPVSDLGDPAVGPGDTAMGFHPLWPRSRGKQRSLASYALMTPETATTIAETGGFGADAYRILRCSDQALHSQLIRRPVGERATDVQAEAHCRATAILDMITDFIDRLGPLAPASLPIPSVRHGEPAGAAA